MVFSNRFKKRSFQQHINLLLLSGFDGSGGSLSRDVVESSARQWLRKPCSLTQRERGI